MKTLIDDASAIEKKAIIATNVKERIGKEREKGKLKQSLVGNEKAPIDNPTQRTSQNDVSSDQYSRRSLI